MPTAVKTARTLVAAATSNAAAATTRGTLQLATALGGILTFKMTNGGTGPTVQCTANVLVAHNAALPTAASRGTDWKTVYSVANGTVASTIGEWSYTVGPEVYNLEIEFTGNTAQAVVVEAYFTEITSVG